MRKVVQTAHNGALRLLRSKVRFGVAWQGSVPNSVLAALDKRGVKYSVGQHSGRVLNIKETDARTLYRAVFHLLVERP